MLHRLAAEVAPRVAIQPFEELTRSARALWPATLVTLRSATISQLLSLSLALSRPLCGLPSPSPRSERWDYHSPVKWLDPSYTHVEALATSPANSRRRRLTATPPANNSSNTKHHNNATPTARVAHGGSGVWVADCTHFCYSAGFWALQLHALVTTLAEKLH